MIKRTIVLPLEDNRGIPLDQEIEQAENLILKEAGGYTAVNSYGEWIGADGVRFQDRSRTLTVVSDAGTDEALEALLPRLAALLRQEALYSDTVTADASFVAAGTAVAAPAA